MGALLVLFAEGKNGLRGVLSPNNIRFMGLTPLSLSELVPKGRPIRPFLFAVF